MLYPDTWLYCYSEEESIHYLYGHSFFSPDDSSSLPWAPYPAQSLNLWTVLAIAGSRWIPVGRIFLLWVVQSLLCAALLWRIRIFLQGWVNSQNHTFIFLLLAAHPWFWRLLLFSPSMVLTLLLIFECLNRLSEGERGAAGWYIFLTALGFSGSAGFFFSLLLAVLRFVFYFPAWSEWRRLASHVMISFSPVIPAFAFYLLLSVQNRTLGGAYIIGCPALLPALSAVKLLTGEWADRFHSLLGWFGNGLLDFSGAFLCFGFLALLGVLSRYQEARNSWRRELVLIGFVGISAAVFSFTPWDAARSWLAPFIVIFVVMMVEGIVWLALCFGSGAFYFRWSGFSLLLIATFVSFPTVFHEVFDRARYRLDGAVAVQRTLNAVDRSNELVAVSFEPSIFASALGGRRVIPLNFAIQAPYETPENHYGGRRVGLSVALSLGVDKILLFPDYDQVKKGDRGDIHSTFLAPWWEILEEEYNHERYHNLEIYTRRDRSAEKVMKRSFLQLREEDRLEEVISIAQWLGVDEWLNERRAPLFQTFAKMKEPVSEGIRWTFESGNSFTETVGFAYGFSPDRSTSAAGTASAGANGAAERELGSIRSSPFVIEGDEFRFYADIPSDSTRSLVCLAVKQRIGFGADQRTKCARHVFDHQPGESLMDETFFYIQPSELLYLPGEISGWRVVRIERGGAAAGWRFYNWSLDPWRGRPAVWLSADWDWRGSVRIDHLFQAKRPKGLYWNFEDGTYQGWSKTGDAFLDTPSTGACGNQDPIEGIEGNYFINTYTQRGDSATGVLTSPPFVIEGTILDFLIGGGNAIETLYLSLEIGGNMVYRATGDRSESMRRVRWDLRPWKGREGRLLIVDYAMGPWGHVLVDDVRLWEPPSESIFKNAMKGAFD